MEDNASLEDDLSYHRPEEEDIFNSLDRAQRYFPDYSLKIQKCRMALDEYRSLHIVRIHGYVNNGARFSDKKAKEVKYRFSETLWVAIESIKVQITFKE